MENKQKPSIFTRSYKYVGSFFRLKQYCLKCMAPRSCQCSVDNIIQHSSKLRPPLTVKNKVIFRKFLDDCPTFVNGVEDHQRELFLKLLQEVRYFNKEINKYAWTKIENKRRKK